MPQRSNSGPFPDRANEVGCILTGFFRREASDRQEFVGRDGEPPPLWWKRASQGRHIIPATAIDADHDGGRSRRGRARQRAEGHGQKPAPRDAAMLYGVENVGGAPIAQGKHRVLRDFG